MSMFQSLEPVNAMCDIHGRRDFVDVVKVLNLEMGSEPALCTWAPKAENFLSWSQNWSSEERQQEWSQTQSLGGV